MREVRARNDIWTMDVQLLDYWIRATCEELESKHAIEWAQEANRYLLHDRLRAEKDRLCRIETDAVREAGFQEIIDQLGQTKVEMRSKLAHHRSVLGIRKAIIKERNNTNKLHDNFLGVLRKKKLYGQTPSHKFGDIRTASTIAKADYFVRHIQGSVTPDLEARLQQKGPSYLVLHREVMLQICDFDRGFMAEYDGKFVLLV
jgi:hypothetical protein